MSNTPPSGSVVNEAERPGLSSSRRRSRTVFSHCAWLSRGNMLRSATCASAAPPVEPPGPGPPPSSPSASPTEPVHPESRSAATLTPAPSIRRHRGELVNR
ncbi:hypothetical protein BE11_45250 [Sorangium cellulosum]|nr:hypothetical protein BE11_45250 [Sorangium cellulosum]